MSAEKDLKIQEFICSQCSKNFNSEVNYLTHIKTKHSSGTVGAARIEATKNVEPKVLESEKNDKAVKVKKEAKDTTPKESKNGKQPRVIKGKGFESYQQDLQDRVYAFLGELGEKHSQNIRQVENISEQSDRMMGQANYLENNVVRTPFEQEFDVRQETPEANFESADLRQMFTTFEADTLVLNDKLLEQRDMWQLRDPMEIERYDEEEFSLINISNVVNNYPRKGLKLTYPQFSIFMLWLAKICKPSAWKQFYFLIGYTLYEFKEYLQKHGTRQRTIETWKAFVNNRQKNQNDSGNYKIPKAIESRLNILDSSDAGTLIQLYQKWVIFFAVI